MLRCAQCVLPESTPNISFDEHGVCNYCKSYVKYPYEGEEKLRTLLESYRGKGKKYDILVTVSGGRDSTFTLLKLVKDYRLKVLAVNYQNPFVDGQANVNIDNAVKILNVDLVSFRLKNHIHERTFKSSIEAWAKNPSPATVPIVCMACKTIWWDILKIAKTHQIHCIVSGGNPLEYTSFKNELLHVSRDEKQENVFIKSLMGILSEVRQNPSYMSPFCLTTMMKGYFFGDPYALGSRIFGKGISRIDLFHYIPWNEKEVLSRIKTELKWESPSKYRSTWRFDCQIGHLKDYMYTRTLHMTERDDFYSKMIREGLITREEALKRLEYENFIYYDELEKLFSTSKAKKIW